MEIHTEWGSGHIYMKPCVTKMYNSASFHLKSTGLHLGSLPEVISHFFHTTNCWGTPVLEKDAKGNLTQSMASRVYLYLSLH